MTFIDLWYNINIEVNRYEESGVYMNDYKYNALVFKAFCDESRLRIIEQLRQKEMCACNLLDVLPISQSTLSHHMKILVDSGMADARKEGKWVYYSLSAEGVSKAKKLLDVMTQLDENYRASCVCGDEVRVNG